MRFILFLLLNGSLFAQTNPPPTDTTSVSRVLRIGVIDVPPYCIQDDQGNWDGMSVRLWRRVAETLDLRYEYVSMTEEDEWMDDLANGSVEVVIHAELDAERSDRFAYTQHHHTSNLAVATPKRNSVLDTLRAFFSPSFFWVVGSVAVLLLIVGIIIYLVERNPNPDDFGGERSVVQGIGSGFWWAGVTLTTIGYGDKAPKSLGGRIVAMLWMLIAIGISASLTAAIVNASNTSSTVSFPDDLSNERVAAVRNSQAADYLTQRGVQFREIHHIKDGLRSLKEDDLDMVVGSSTVINYLVKNNTNFRAGVETTDAAPVGFAFALDRNHPQYAAINRAVIQHITSSGWLSVKKQYLGEK